MNDARPHRLGALLALLALAVLSVRAQDTLILFDLDSTTGVLQIDTIVRPADPAPPVKPSKTPPTTALRADSVVRSDTMAFDSTARHSPRKAALLSLALPGLGQIYNERYWKLPIVYGGLGGLSFWLGRNVKTFRGYRDAYRLDVDEDPSTDGSYNGIDDAGQLRVRRDEAKRQLDLSAVLVGVFYLLQIVDATVDAHLKDYDISEDLSLRVEPSLQPMLAGGAPAPCLTLTLEL